jgi:hypothetical protein
VEMGATANCSQMACLAQPLGTDLHRLRQSFIMGAGDGLTGVGLSSLLKDEGRNFVYKERKGRIKGCSEPSCSCVLCNFSAFFNKML